MSLDGCLIVDPVSMAALHILQEERHPSKMGIGQSKEGFSLLSMLNGCVGVPGRRLMRLWFLRPIVDVQVCWTPWPGGSVLSCIPVLGGSGADVDSPT